MVHARRSEKRMVEACERRILEFPLSMDAREVAKELKREGWYAWASSYESIIFSDRARAGKSGDRGMTYFLFRLRCLMPEDQPSGTKTILTWPSDLCGLSFNDCDNRKSHPRAHGRKTPTAPAA